MRLELPPGIAEGIRAEVQSVLGAGPAFRARGFLMRVNRWWHDLHEGLRGLHPHPEQLADRLLLAAARGYVARPDALHQEDARRSLQPDWFQEPTTIGYAAYPELFAPPGSGLAGVAERIPHLTRLGVRYLHLLPPLPAQEPADDEVRELATRLRHAGISLCLDLRLNQVDWENPDVLVELADRLLHLANLGVGILRWDGSAFPRPREGQPPQAHQIIRALRAMMRMTCPSVLLQAEVVAAPDELVGYLGQGRHWGKLSDLAPHHALMVQLWSMLATRETRLSSTALNRLPAVPTSTAWVTYLRRHDDIRWTVEDRDAESVSLSGGAHRAFLADFYCGDFFDSFAEGSVIEQDGERRIRGTTAGLCGVGRALAAADPAELDLALNRLLLAYTVVLGFGGLPVIWSGDEVAAHRGSGWAEDVGLLAELDGPEQTPARRVFDGLCRIIAIRSGLAQMHSAWPAKVLVTPAAGVFAVVRDHPEGRLLQLYNVTEEEAAVPHWWFTGHGIELATCSEHLVGVQPRTTGEALVLQPYQALWLTS